VVMQVKLKLKTCKACKQKFMPVKPLQHVCDWKCAIDYNLASKEKNNRLNALKSRKETKVKLEKYKTWQQWFDECKAIAQEYARLRDRFDGCISCDKASDWWGQWHGSHFRPAGNFKAVALNLLNIHKGCSECNNYKSGNLIEFQDRLIVKIGQDRVDWLKSQTQPYRHSIEYLKRYKQVMGKRLRRLEKRINN
jgi:hypothetical protein